MTGQFQTSDYWLPESNLQMFLEWNRSQDKDRSIFVLKLTERINSGRFILIPICATRMRYSWATMENTITSVARECNANPELVAVGLNYDDAVSFIKTYSTK